MNKFIIFHFFYIILSIPAFAQNKISGVIYDQEDIPLEGVSVDLFVENDSLQSIYISGTISDSLGSWIFLNLKPNNYLIKFSYLGYEIINEKVFQLESDLSFDTIQMQKLYTNLGEVEIVADLLTIKGNKETRFFTLNEKARAISGLELMTNLPNLFLDKLNNKLSTSERKSILIISDGKIIDEIDLIGLHPNDIIKTDYYSQPPAKYRNMGFESVLSITTKRNKEDGGNIMTNLKNGFTTGYGTDIIQGKYSSSNDDYSLRYFIDYRDLNKNIFSQKIYSELDKNIYDVDRNGVNSLYKGEYHVFSGSYSNIKNADQLFSLKANFSISPGKESIKQDVMNEIITTNTKTKYYSPNLDLYYSKKFNNNQNLMLNIVNTYYNTKSERNIYDIDSKIESTSYSIISEVDYSINFEKFDFSTGIRHFYKKLHEDFYGNNDNIKTNNAINNIYTYLEISKEWSKLTTTFGIGGEQSFLNVFHDKKSFFAFKPELSINYALNKNSSFRLISYIRSNVPNIYMLSESPTYLDSIFISKGSNILKPYNLFVNSLSYTLNKPVYYFKTSLSFFYANNPIYTVINNNGIYLEKTFLNIKNMNTTKFDISFNLKPFNWISLNMYGATESQRFLISNDSYNHWFYLLNISSSLYYKNFSLNNQLFIQNKSLEGNLFRKINDYYGNDITWKRKNLSVSLGCVFTNSPTKLETYKNLKVYYKESKIWNNFKGLCYLQLNYYLNFGKNIQRSIYKKMNNEDLDIGINPDNKAKQ